MGDEEHRYEHIFLLFAFLAVVAYASWAIHKHVITDERLTKIEQLLQEREEK